MDSEQVILGNGTSQLTGGETVTVGEFTPVNPSLPYTGEATTAMPITYVPVPGEAVNNGAQDGDGYDFHSPNARIDRLVDHVNREIGVAQEVPLHQRLADLEELCTKTFGQIKAKFNY